MPMRMALFVTAIFTVSLGAVSVTVRASHAADDCLTKPNAAAPQGSHWYYRVDRTTHRECWYLGAEGGKVRQDASPVLSHPSKISAQPAPQTPAKVANAEVGAAEATSTETAPLESASGQPTTPEDNPTATLSTSDIPTSILSIDRGSVSMRDSDAEEQATTESEDEMPLIWPTMSPAEPAERPPEIPTSFARLGAVLAAVLGLAAMVSRMIFKLSAARRPSPSHSRDRRGLATRTRRSGKQASPTFANNSAAAHHAGMTRRTGKALSSSSDPVVDIELSVRRLLRELQRRQHGHARRDSKQTLRKAAA
jgi:hypothetical protein